jgi:hypothetical protein
MPERFLGELPSTVESVERLGILRRAKCAHLRMTTFMWTRQDGNFIRHNKKGEPKLPEVKRQRRCFT